MAKISLGQAALAFAGGAAGEYNQQVNKKRDSEMRMRERAEELMTMHEQRLAETRYGEELKNEISTEAKARQLESLGGTSTVPGLIYYYSQFAGLTGKQLEAAVRNAHATGQTPTAPEVRRASSTWAPQGSSTRGQDVPVEDRGTPASLERQEGQESASASNLVPSQYQGISASQTETGKYQGISASASASGPLVTRDRISNTQGVIDSVNERMSPVLEESPALAQAAGRMGNLALGSEALDPKVLQDDLDSYFPPEARELTFKDMPDGTVLGLDKSTGDIVTTYNFKAPKDDPLFKQQWDFYQDQLAKGRRTGNQDLINSALQGLNILNTEKSESDMESTKGKEVADLQRLDTLRQQNPDNPMYSRMYELMEKQLSGENTDGWTIQKGERTNPSSGDVETYIRSVKVNDDGTMETGDELLMGDNARSQGQSVRVSPEVDQLNTRVSMLASFSSDLENSFKMRTPGSENVPGFIRGALGSIRTNLRGFAEMAGVDPETPQDLIDSMVSVGMSDQEVDNLIRNDKSVMYGWNRTDAKLLVYGLANILRDAGSVKVVNNQDIIRATEIVKGLNSSQGGLGSFGRMRHSIDSKLAANRQMLYQRPDIPAYIREENGVQLLRIMHPGIPSEMIAREIGPDGKPTGRVGLYNSVEDARNGIVGQSLEELIRMAPNGSLRPRFDRLRYIGTTSK